MVASHVIGALREKRAELSATVRQIEQQLAQHRSDLAHLDATMRLFDPDIQPDEIWPRGRITAIHGFGPVNVCA